jgi:hypothetical protein
VLSRWLPNGRTRIGGVLGSKGGCKTITASAAWTLRCGVLIKAQPGQGPGGGVGLPASPAKQKQQNPSEIIRLGQGTLVSRLDHLQRCAYRLVWVGGLQAGDPGTGVFI